MKNLRMRTKLSLGFGIILLLTSLMGGIAFNQLNSINEDALLTSEALIPQTSIAIALDERMRDAGLNIRSFSDTGDLKRWEKVQAALSKIKESITQAEQLARSQPELRATPLFLQNVSGSLGAFEKACASIKNARDKIDYSIDAMGKAGPDTTTAVNELIDRTLADIRKELHTGNETRVDRLFSYLDRYNNLFDVIETLRRSMFVAMATNNHIMMDETIEAFKEPLRQFTVLEEELRNVSEVLNLISRAKQALISYYTAANNTMLADEQLKASDEELISSYLATLELVFTLVEKTQTRNAEIADSMTADSKSAIRNLAILLVIALSVGLFMTIFLTLGITRPLARFVDAATRLSAGQFDTRVDIDSTDEIGITASNINKAFDVVVDKVVWYEAMLDAIPSFISVTDMNRRWTFVNKAAEISMNKKRAELVGHPCKEWKTPCCDSQNCGINCLEQGKQQSLFSMGEGHFNIQPSYIHDRNGKPIGHIELANDITDLTRAQKKAESALSEGMYTAASKIENVVAVMGAAVRALTAQIEHSEQGSSEQAARMSETATAMAEMNCTVTEVARNAEAAAEVALAARRKAELGAVVVGKVVQGIQTVQTDSLVLKSDMSALAEHAQAITRIMAVISDIADQTNLLALNAAIEAARAGDAGRGFAVVADEVRKLAEKTMTSTTDVSQAIRAIQQSAAKSAQQVDIAVCSIEDATTLANESGTALGEIVQMVDHAADQVRAIATASEQQSASSDEINRSVTQVNVIASDTAEAMQEAAHAVAELASQSEILAKLVEEMKRS